MSIVYPFLSPRFSERAIEDQKTELAPMATTAAAGITTTATDLFHTLQYYLVTPPSITTFQWTAGVTLGATLPFLITTVFLYLATVFLLQTNILFATPHLSPPLFRFFSTFHNLNLLLLSLTMSIGCILSSLTHLPSLSHLFCFPPETTTSSSGPIFFWAYVFYLSKIYEFVDTLLVILNPNKRLTFLHVYHHAVVVVMCYIWLETSQSLMPIALVTNASVHVLMYGYYLSSGLGWRWGVRWKRAVTNCQILQFGFSFLMSIVFLWMHFGGNGCSGFGGWVFNAVFNVSLFGLFVDFHRKSYGGKKMEKKT